MNPNYGHAAPDKVPASAAPVAPKDPRLRNRPMPLPEALKTPPPFLSTPAVGLVPPYNPYVPPIAAPNIPPPYRTSLPPFFPPQAIGTPLLVHNYPLVPHGVLPPASAEQLPPEPPSPSAPKLTPARQTYGDFKRARAAQQNSFDELKESLPSLSSFQQCPQGPKDNYDRKNAHDQGSAVNPKPYDDWAIPNGVPPPPTPGQLSQLVQFPPPVAFYKEQVPIPDVKAGYGVAPDHRGRAGINPPHWNMNQRPPVNPSLSGERPKMENYQRKDHSSDRNRMERPFRPDEKRDYESEGGRDGGRSSRDQRKGNDNSNNRPYNGKSFNEQEGHRRGRDERDNRKSRNDSDDRRDHYRDRDRERQGNFRERNRLPVHYENKERSDRIRSSDKYRPRSPRAEGKEEGQVPTVSPAPALFPVILSGPVRRDIGGFFVRVLPTELKEEKKTAERSSSRERSPLARDRKRSNSRSRSHDRRRSRSHSRHRGRSRSRSRDRRRSRSRSRDRRRSRSRSRDRRRSRSRDRSRRRNRSSRRSRSRGRGRRSRSRDRSKRSRSRGRPRRDRSLSQKSDLASMSAIRRELAQNSSSRNEHREELIDKWRRLNCKTDDELERKLIKISKMNTDELLEQDAGFWIRSAPATTYYERDPLAVGLMRGTEKLSKLCLEFHKQVIEPGVRLRAERDNCLPPLPNRRFCPCSKSHDDADSSCSSGSDDGEDHAMEELTRKMKHPYRLHKEVWYNEPGEMNDGPLCRCSIKAKRSGIRHGIYAGEVPGVGIFSSVTQTSPFTHTEAMASLAPNWQQMDSFNKSVTQETQPSPVEEEPTKPNDVAAVDPESLNISYPCCDLDSNNAGKLYNYRITITPPTNFLSKTPTIICHDGHEFIFTGFSLLSHYPLPKLPVCKVIRFNIEYRILYAEESFPENFTIRECNLFYDYLFKEILELVDLDLNAKEGKCPVFHFMPRFVRELQPEGNELLPMSIVMKYLLQSYRPLVPKEILKDIPHASNSLWLKFAEEAKGMIVTKPGMKPSSIRVDQLDKDVTDEEASAYGDADRKPSLDSLTNVGTNAKRENKEENNYNGKKVDCEIKSDAETETTMTSSQESLCRSDLPEEMYPVIVHFGLRPSQLSYAGNSEYQQAWRKYVKHRHLIANLAKPSLEKRTELANKEAELMRMRAKVNMKRDVTTTVSSEGFYRTGIMCDVVQHALLIPVLTTHLRFHRSLEVLERRIGYTFKNRSLLQLALTHPSYRENFGTNPDHARNSLQNCGIRHPEYGDRRIHYMSTKKRGISTLMSIMSQFGCKREEESSISHYERLEFLGDAVVEFVSTIHLFHIFRDLEEGGLATYRAALVQNQHLALLAKVLSLDAYLLYAHGSDLCHDVELNHALANCFESLMGALYLDGGIEVADRVFGNAVFGYDKPLLDVWVNYPPHILQEQEPGGDRRNIEKIEFLQNLVKLEESIGFTFRHIRILARAFTDRSVGYTNLTLGSNQRLEFLGDSVLQLSASNYLYKHFPDHHEGHLSLLRSSLVNNNTQSMVCDELGLTSYARYAPTKGELKVKDRADLLEAFLGALYVDTASFTAVETFCNVCFFPRLQTFIMNQEWNDPKSKLQQCALTLRTMDGSEPDIPSYKVVESKGPTNTRTYSVAVYFRGTRLATATGHSIQQAEMNAAHAAMDNCLALFPQLNGKQDKKSSKSSDKKVKVFERTGTPERYKIRKSTSPSKSKSGHSGRSRSASRKRSRSRSKQRLMRRSRSQSRRLRSRSRRRSRSRKRSRSHSRRSRSASGEDRSHSIEKSKDRSLSGSPRSSKRSLSDSPARGSASREGTPEESSGMSPQAPTLTLFSSWDIARIKARRGGQSSQVNQIPTNEEEEIQAAVPESKTQELEEKEIAPVHILGITEPVEQEEIPTETRGFEEEETVPGHVLGENESVESIERPVLDEIAVTGPSQIEDSTEIIAAEEPCEHSPAENDQGLFYEIEGSSQVNSAVENYEEVQEVEMSQETFVPIQEVDGEASRDSDAFVPVQEVEMSQ